MKRLTWIDVQNGKLLYKIHCQMTVGSVARVEQRRSCHLVHCAIHQCMRECKWLDGYGQRLCITFTLKIKRNRWIYWTNNYLGKFMQIHKWKQGVLFLSKINLNEETDPCLWWNILLQFSWLVSISLKIPMIFLLTIAILFYFYHKSTLKWVNSKLFWSSIHLCNT